MTTKRNNSTSSATLLEEIKVALSPSRPEASLSSIEEKALRMRHGQSLQHDAPLGLKAETGTEAAGDLALIEAKLIQAWRRRQDSLQPSQVTVRDAESSVDGQTERKILRALRRK